MTRFRSIAWIFLVLLCMPFAMASSLVHAQTAPVQNIAGLRLLSPSQSVSPGILALDPSISADGKRIAFWSNAPDLVSGDNNNVSDVFLYDTATSTLQRISIAARGEQGTYPSVSPVISANGNFIAFESLSNSLTGLGDGNRVILRKDMTNGTLNAVSPVTIPNAAVVEGSQASMSADGRLIAFTARLVSTDFKNTIFTIMLRDMTATDAYFPLTGIDGNQPNGNSFTPALSADGRYLVFHSSANNLVNFPVPATEIYRLDLQTNMISLVSANSKGEPANDLSQNAAVSADGRYVVFESRASNLATVFPQTRNFYRKDMITGAISLVSADSNGRPAYDPYLSGAFRHSAAISADGNWVAFESLAANLGYSDLNLNIDLFLKNMTTGELIALDCNAQTGELSALGAGSPGLSADGAVAVFHSSSLLPGGPAGGAVYASDHSTCPKPVFPTVETGWWLVNGRTDMALFLEISPTNRDIFLGLINFDQTGRGNWSYSVLQPLPKTPNGFQGALIQPGTGAGQNLGGVNLTATDLTHIVLNIPALFPAGSVSATRLALSGVKLPQDPMITLVPGWWWPPNNPGAGYPIEIQGTRMLLATLQSANQPGGPWLMGSAFYSGSDFSGTLFALNNSSNIFADLLGLTKSTAISNFDLTPQTPKTATLLIDKTPLNLEKFYQY